MFIRKGKSLGGEHCRITILYNFKEILDSQIMWIYALFYSKRREKY
jgi:hypothetical protein